MANVRLIGNQAINKIMARQPEVQRALESHANRLARIASSMLAGHRRTGDHHITVDRIKNEKYGHIDWFVSLRGSAPMSVEFGHKNHRGGYVHGLYIMSRLL